ncbi:SDR family NAD(P)-dependent oxidoreductase [Chitinophaga rhizosphaerae]|uniref:SDR family NAD(P)-dependent oxidoreductase n=1 Tax=Chitinophaga rhizosphaerae TaxID=1864947 RepID=UPI000F801B44|nr:SDR family oxidoreductase [Chitinophaga rhizosphaerae]
MFNGTTLAVSGGLGDIGSAVARAFAALGANIAIGDVLPEDRAAPLLLEIESRGVAALYTRVDVSDPKAVELWISAAEAALGPVRMVVANAATVTIAGLFDVTADQWQREIDINLNGAFYLTRAAARRMLELQLAGSIVYVGSWAAEAVHPGIPAYAVSKAGMRMLSKSMALELAPHGIMVNEIAPGYVDAGVSRQVWEKAPEQREAAARKTPVRKLITPAEIAREIVKLCDPQNRHITGSTLLMDGGLNLLR